MSREREPLSTERVLRAALALADSDGADGLTMRRLGQALGVEAMSLYKHVPNKDAILDGIVDLVIGEIALPALHGQWKAQLRLRCVSAHEVLLAHPWACKLVMSRVNVGPAMIRYTDTTLGVLREAGFSVALADHAWAAMDSYLYGFTLRELTFPFQPQEFAEAAETYLPILPPGEFVYLRELAEQVIEGSHTPVSSFTFGLDLLLDGLDRELRTGGQR
jgi:AcrR family transcriptional regulator